MQGKEETIAEINMSIFPVIEDARNSLVWCEIEELESNIEKETVMVYNIDTGKTEIYYYPFKDKKSEKLTDYQYKPACICGSEETVIVSDYIVQGLEDTGKVLYITEK